MQGRCCLSLTELFQNSRSSLCAQAFRHLYVLAAIPRSVSAVDVDTGENVSIPLKITLKSTSCLSPTTHDSKPTRLDPAEVASESRVIPNAAMRKLDAPSEEGCTMSFAPSSVEFVQETPCLLPDEGEVTMYNCIECQVS